MPDILHEIVAHKRVEVERAKAAVPAEELRQRIADLPGPRNFFRAVTRTSDTVNVIAEVKRASPSAGLICEDFDPVAIASAYRENGAVAISCLTDEKYFQGRLEHLSQIKEAVGLPVLRKDFIIDPYQLLEARAAGADAVLLIGEVLAEAELVDLLIGATELKLTTLLEVHDTQTLLRVRPHIGFPHAGYGLLGVNNRNLRTMKTDLTHTLRMLDLIEDPSILVSESGIRTHEDVVKLRSAGIRAVLVGEHLMKQPDPGAALHALIHGNRD